MLKNKLVEQILAERFYIIEKATDDIPPPPTPATPAPSPTPESTNPMAIATAAFLTSLIASGSLLGDIKKLFSPPDPIKSDSDVILSKIPSMLRPETLRNPKLQRVKEFGSAEGKKIAS